MGFVSFIVQAGLSLWVHAPTVGGTITTRTLSFEVVTVRRMFPSSYLNISAVSSDSLFPPLFVLLIPTPTHIAHSVLLFTGIT